MSIRELLIALKAGKQLSMQEAKLLMGKIIRQEISDFQIAALLYGLQLRPFIMDEIEGFVDAIMEAATPVDLPQDAIDMCGTGGDMKNTFNISTLASLLVASMGYPVIKHGNYSATSFVGSSHILEQMGYSFTKDVGQIKAQFESSGFCYIHAPNFHPLLANVAPIRKALQIKTVFNILGPLVHPANLTYRFHGVYIGSLVRLYSELLSRQKKVYATYYSIDGYDEISCTAPYLYFTNSGKKLYQIEKQIDPKTIEGGNSKEESFAIALSIIKGKGTDEQNQVVCTTTARAILLYSNRDNFQEVYEKCVEHLKGEKLHKWVKMLIPSLP